MELASLIAGLSRPEAFPGPVNAVEVFQTHISAVFIGGDVVYKVKKPVHLSFLDFSTPELRQHFCEEEVRLNHRLAPSVYLGVVPITADGQNPRFEGDGPPLDWAVKMRRLPRSAMLEELVDSDQVVAEQLTALARRLADFHRAARADSEIARFGRFEHVSRNVWENFEVAAPTVGKAVSTPVWERLHRLVDSALSNHRSLIEARAERGVPRDTHGDLHLDHVYLFPDRPAPEDLVIVDCIEFNERFRYTDPVADMAFLVMDLQFHGRWELARSFADAWFAASGDAQGRALLPLYVSYRAAVRGKVDGLLLAEPEVPAEARTAALQRARGHWLLALQSLESPERRPALLLIGGLPGSGKSTIAQGLAEQAGFRVIRSDVLRKELAGLSPVQPAGAELGTGIYSAEWNDRTYAECLARAEAALFQGERVAIDATFASESRRRLFLDAAKAWGVPALFLVCEADAGSIRTRLRNRRGDASDADWAVYEDVAKRWETPGLATRRELRPIDSETSLDAAVQNAVRVLHQENLL